MDWQALWEKIKILFGPLWLELWPTIKILITEQGMTAFTSAKNIVATIQTTMPDASGQEKFNAALAQLSSMLLAQGITLGVGILRICIEMAYRKMVATPEVVTEAKEIQEMFNSKADQWQVITP